MYEWIVAGGAAGMIVTEQVRIKRRQKLYRQSYRYIRILQHEDNDSYPDRIKKMVAIIDQYRRTWIEQRTKGREWFRLLFHKSKSGNISIYFGYPEDRTSGIKNVFKNTYPFIEMHEEAHDALPLQISDKKDIEAGYFDLQKKGSQTGYALNPYDGNHGLEDILLSMEAEGVEIWLDMLFTPETNRQLKRNIKSSINNITKADQNKYGRSTSSVGDELVEDFKRALANQPERKAKSSYSRAPRKVSMNDLDVSEQAKVKMMKQRFTDREPVFKVAIRLMAQGKYAKAAVQTVAANIRSNFQLDNSLKFVRNPFIRNRILDAVPYNPANTILMVGNELANLLHLPDAKHRVMERVPYLKRGQRSLDPKDLNEGVSIGKLLHPVEVDRRVKIALRQMNKHFLLTGKTGSGKSSALMEMIQSILDERLKNDNAPGITFMDPARDTVATILNRLRHAEATGHKVDWSKVHYFRLGDEDYSLGLNLLYAKPGEMPDDVVERALSMITRIYGGLNAPQMERVIRNCLTTLVMDTEDHVVLGILPLLRDERFRKRVLARIKDPTIKEFWQFEFPGLEKKLDAVISPILNRLSPFNTNIMMRRLFGQQKWNLPIRKWMDEGHIVLFDVRGVREQILALAGEHIVNQYHAEYQGRSTSAKMHFFIWDEAHRTPYPIVEKMIAEDRKFGAALGFSTQFPEQLPPGLLSAFQENAGNVFTTTLGAGSATIVAKTTSGRFTPKYLQDLPERVVAVYTAYDKEGKAEQTTFTVECPPPFLYKPDGSGEWADHKDEKDMEKAIEWALEKGRELMIRDTVLGTDVDKMIHNYLRPGTPYQAEQVRSMSVDLEKKDLPAADLAAPPITGSTKKKRAPAPTFDSTSAAVIEIPAMEEEVEETGFDEFYNQAFQEILKADEKNIDLTGEMLLQLLEKALDISKSEAERLIDAMEAFGDISDPDEYGRREVYGLPGASNKPAENKKEKSSRWM